MRYNNDYMTLQTVKDLKLANKCLQKKLSDYKVSKDANLEKCACLQKEINVKNEKVIASFFFFKFIFYFFHIVKLNVLD